MCWGASDPDLSRTQGPSSVSAHRPEGKPERSTK
nr:MAG TPA_asm: hypothetical protein [Caudoviricetes sp.]